MATGGLPDDGLEPLTGDEDRLVCSAKGCRAPAVYQLRWNNPKLHAPEARKVWLACEEHRYWLGDFLAVRGFLRAVDRLPTAGAEAGPR